jgi:ATP-dependent DNA helicase PIF1
MNLSPDQKYAFDVLTLTRRHATIIGGAGTGKSTLTRHFTAHLDEQGEPYVIVAPTGVAALNVGGLTAHKLFGLPVQPGPTLLAQASRRKTFTDENTGECFLPRMTFIFDEISMIRADVLDAIDRALRYDEQDAPFGGARVVFVGDPLQLPPIIPSDDIQLTDHMQRVYGGGSWFFHSAVYRVINPMPLLLDVSHRQSDLQFFQVLSHLRYGDTRYLSFLNERARIEFGGRSEAPGVAIRTHRKQVKEINDRRLAALEGTARMFEAECQGTLPKDSKGDAILPVERNLELKVGARVLCAANIYRRFYNEQIAGFLDPIWLNEDTPDPQKDLLAANGSSGTVISLDPLRVQFETGYELGLGRYLWEFKGFNAKKRSVEVIGTLKQVPLMLGWAITTHKSQGMSLTQAEIDVRRMFDDGQSYVALSRVFSIEGLTLCHYLMPNHFRANRHALEFMNAFTQAAQWARVHGWNDR